MVNVHNKSTTFRVYETRDTLGDIQPILDSTQPTGKGKKGCGVGQILVAIVAAAAAFVAATGAGATIAGFSQATILVF